MNFSKKLQELRKQRGLTQEELAKALFVSRTAISKWESGRGYPNIDSLREIAKFFSITVDSLLSPDEVLDLAEADSRENQCRFTDLIYGLFDTCMGLLLFLPLFASRTGGAVISTSLLSLAEINPILKVMFISVCTVGLIYGILTLALQNIKIPFSRLAKYKISLAISVAALLLFVLGLHPYAAVFVFVLLSVKTIILKNLH